MYSTVVSRPASAAIAPGARARPNRRASAPRSAVAASRPLAATSLVPASRSTAIRRSEALQATLPARASVVARAASSAAPAPAAGEDTGETTAMINTVKVRARARRLSRGINETNRSSRFHASSRARTGRRDATRRDTTRSLRARATYPTVLPHPSLSSSLPR